MTIPRFTWFTTMPRNSRLSIGIIVAIVLVALGLLYRTESNASQVSRETARIASSGRGLNSDTDSIAQLGRTNRIARDIMESLARVNTNLGGIDAATQRIAGKATTINQSTTSIDTSTTSINASEHSIDGSVSNVLSAVGSLNGSLAGVNQNAARILSASLAIQRGVTLISTNLADARAVTDQILGEAGDISNRVQVTNHEAACVDNGLNGGQKC